MLLNTLVTSSLVAALTYQRNHHQARERALSRSSWDVTRNGVVLSPAATRLAVAHWHAPAAVIGLDIRKMHDLNRVLGYNNAQYVISELMCCLRLEHGRTQDMIGQWGGDEFAILVSDPDAGMLVAERMIEKTRALTSRLTPEQRTQLATQTAGLVDGIHIAMAVIPHSTNVARDVVRAIGRANELKEGRETGDRSTSGAIGTVVEVLSCDCG